MPAPDGSHLYLLAYGRGAFGPSTAPPLTLVALRLPDGVEVARHTQVQAPDAGYFAWSGRLTPDGRALYRVAAHDHGSSASVSFLDLATASVEHVDVEFNLPRELEFPLKEWGLSPDGGHLYMLSPLSGELAVVDLTGRRVLQTVALADSSPLTARSSSLDGLLAGLRGFFVPQALAKVPFSERLQVSPDGQWLFATGAKPERRSARGDGVWAIDTEQCCISHRWLEGTEPWMLLLSGDARHLYVHEMQRESGSSSVLRVIDASTGVEVATTELLGYSQLYTLADLYRDRYGRSPVSTRSARDQAVAFATIATMDVQVSPQTVVAGKTATLQVRFLHPASGRRVEPGQAGVRFESPERVIAVLSRGTEPNHGQIVTLDPVGYGIYRGNHTLSVPDSWSRPTLSVQVVAKWTDGSRRRAFAPDAITVQPTFAGSDGRRYVLRMASDPDPPVVDQPALVRLALLDSETTALLPDDVEPVSGLPALLDVSFYGEHGFTTVPLPAVDRGVYEGPVRLWATGPWRLTARLGDPAGDTYIVGVLHAAGRKAATD